MASSGNDDKGRLLTSLEEGGNNSESIAPISAVLLPPPPSSYFGETATTATTEATSAAAVAAAATAMPATTETETVTVDEERAAAVPAAAHAHAIYGDGGGADVDVLEEASPPTATATIVGTTTAAGRRRRRVGDVGDVGGGRSNETSPLIPPAAADVLFDDDGNNNLLNNIDDGSYSPVWRDVPFAVLFYLHFGVMIYLGVAVAPKGYETFESVDFESIKDAIREGSDDVTEDQLAQLEAFVVESGKFLSVYPQRLFRYLLVPSAFVAFALAILVIVLLMRPCPRTMVYGCLIESFALMSVLMIAGCLASSSAFSYLFTAVVLASIAYYVTIAWRMVPFAAVNLKVAVRAISQNFGIFVVALAFAKLGLLWVAYWCYVLVGTFAYKSNECQQQHPDSNFDMSSKDYDDVCDPPAPVVLFFLISLYWTTTITMNMIQVTVAGVAATFCYAKEDANHCCSLAVYSSLFRSLTYSFGSVCFGSLLQAFVSIFRFMVEAARNQRDRNDNCGCCGSLFLCILECIASLLEEFIYFFNQYAYIYAGIYGFS